MLYKRDHGLLKIREDQSTEVNLCEPMKGMRLLKAVG